MSHLDILLPFALPPPDLANDLFRALNTPALAMLLSRGAPVSRQSFDGFSGALAHESWLVRQFGFDDRIGLGGSPQIASAVMRTFDLSADEGVWFVVHPVHIHIARDHLVLTDLRQQTLPEHEARALFDAALPLFAEAGKTLKYGDAATWFVRADEWDSLQTSTPDAACGRNIDIWMPKGRGERDWRKLQNEVQMHWHVHPVNAQREARGARPVNSLWLWGGAAAGQQRGQPAYREGFNLSGWMRAAASAAGCRTSAPDVSHLISAAPDKGLLMLDSLVEPALAGDWAGWLEKLQMLESGWFQPLLDAIGKGTFHRLGMILTDQSGIAQFHVTRRALRKFWIKPGLARMLP